MIAEVYGEITAFKAMFDMAKGLKDISDTTIRNAAIIDLQEQILSAQATQSALVERVRSLEKEVADLETWNAEKKKYELKDIGGGAFAYMLKFDARNAKPPHWVCAHCYANGNIFVLQYTVHAPTQKAFRRGWFCPSCHNEIEPTAGFPQWLD